MMEIILIVLSIVITLKIGKALFSNTIGTTSAYLWRYLLIFFIVITILASIFGNIGSALGLL